MKVRWESSSDEARIELLPLMDVIFCILTFFILAALQLTRQQAIVIDLPQAQSSTIEMQKMLLVSLDPQGQIYIEQKPMDADRLFYELQVYRQMNPDSLMVLYAAKSTPYNNVVQVLDLMREVGGDRVALATVPISGFDETTTTSPNINITPSLEVPLPDPAGEGNPFWDPNVLP